ncbi:MAG TPA: NAD(P)-dependent oxidoreductase [Aggregatilinea sp.]|uniref:NAD(P)-dependent oxidoreductase n=1 Tax=Aggregatilinea sp. TaxID=2806333 RepID=UPI002B5444D9|nr:NAD(P)-dependent oxidoreductase [Aggregatilinea sp.]HML21907.1 NAD(P)-dependent oxidoreductase [Aggregatilinea sp.]
MSNFTSQPTLRLLQWTHSGCSAGKEADVKTGFIGLGTLGKAMAQRLIEQDVELVVWNRTLEKADGLSADVASSPAGVLARADLVFLNLRDSAAVEDVLTGDNGLLSADCTGKIIVDTTTNHFEPVVGFAEMVAARGGQYLEAPVAGSVVPASKGALTIFVSGDESAFEQARPTLEHLGQKLFFLGAPGLATRMKLVNNMVLGTFMATLAEAVVLGEAAGLGKAQVIEMLAAGGGNSGVLNAKRQKLLDEDFSPHFSVSNIYKDLHYLLDLARTVGHPAFTGSASRDLFALAALQGHAEDDFSAIYAALKGSEK